ncbi:MAG: GNAT family N-acetyltransferase [Oscillospiraceae bacterium]
MYLETERTAIRDFVPGDADALQEILGDEETMKFLEPAYSPEKCAKFLHDFCIGQNGAFAAAHKESGRLIGYLLFKPWGEPDVYEMGWIFHRAFWRQGFAFETCSRLIHHAFAEMDVQKIFAETIDPVKSVGLMEKLGMRLEGVQRRQTRNDRGDLTDLYLYGILKEDDTVF